MCRSEFQIAHVFGHSSAILMAMWSALKSLCCHLTVSPSLLPFFLFPSYIASSADPKRVSSFWLFCLISACLSVTGVAALFDSSCADVNDILLMLNATSDTGARRGHPAAQTRGCSQTVYRNTQQNKRQDSSERCRSDLRNCNFNTHQIERWTLSK